MSELDAVVARPSGLKILVVDDTAANRLLLCSFLAKLGHSAVKACDGEEAVAVFESERPDLVLMDVMMPGVDGLDATRRIRELCGDRWVPIIFITALEHDEDLIRGLQAGGDDYLAKPVNLAVLEAKLRAFGRTLALQRRLDNARRRAQAVSDHVIDAIVTIDENGVVQSCNPAAERMFGYEAGALIGHNVNVLMPAGDGAAYGSYVSAYLRGGAPKVLGIGREVLARRSDGSFFPVELGVSNLELNGERMFVSIMRDVSERREAEHQIKANLEHLQRYHDAQEQENILAREILDNLGQRRGGMSDSRLHYSVDAARNFSGDLVAAARSPEGKFYVMLADATGHGLAAAISVLPAVSVFYGMVNGDLPLRLIVGEMNTKLREFIPTGRFIAATLVCLDEQECRGEIWLGGMPEALLIDARGEVLRRFSSNHLPLGIDSTTVEMTETERFAWSDSVQIALCSDGVLEAESGEGEAFGIERLMAAASNAKPEARHEALRSALRNHLDGQPAQDDASLVLIDCVAAPVGQTSEPASLAA
jgi:PAS domain S-box-containing protein